MRRHAQEHPQAVKHLAPAVFRAFACAASRCPDSCCRAGWEIAVDEETLARYQTLPGPHGGRVRQAVRPGPEPLLRQDESLVCVLLDEDGLCHAQKRFGHESLCKVCREYPRFRREFGNLTEHGLSLSCPTAYALATGTAPAWDQWEDEAPIVPNDLDPETYLRLRAGRDLALDLLAREDLPLETRLALVRRLAEAMQNAKEARIRHDWALRLRRWRLASGFRDRAQSAGIHKPAGTPPARYFAGYSRCGQRPLRCGFHPPEGASIARPMQQAPNDRAPAQLAARFAGLEILSPVWRDALHRFAALAEAGELPANPYQTDRPEEYARWLWHSLYKYWLDALDDGNLLGRADRSLAMLRLGLAMDNTLPGEGPFLRRISREIEHCEENLAALLKG